MRREENNNPPGIVFFPQINMEANVKGLDLDLYCVESTMEEGEELGKEILLFWEDEEVLFLSSKEKDTILPRLNFPLYIKNDPYLLSARMEAVRWLLSASFRFGFTAQTTILAVDYFDRFFSSEGRRVKGSHPWLAQFCSVACLSLAAKMEETHVPLLLDLQVEETRYVFESRSIQRMELLVLSTLDWRMNPVTPLSFVDLLLRKMTSKKEKNKHLEFQKMCHSTLLSLIADLRWLEYLPSSLASATMIHVLEQLGFGDQISTLLSTTKEEIDGCYQFVLECGVASNKRKHPVHPPSSPVEFIGSVFSFESHNNSWASLLSSSDDDQHHLSKRPSTRAVEEQCKPPIYRVFT